MRAQHLWHRCADCYRAGVEFETDAYEVWDEVLFRQRVGSGELELRRGLWAIFVLVPLLRTYVNPVLIKTLGWTGLFVAPDFGIGMFAAGVILAIMILPIISSLTREVMTAVPDMQREAVLALGATRWEMIRMGVLRNALGETMAVAMVIGSSPTISKSLLAPAATMASVIANEFAEASDDTYRSALIEIGLALFLVTIVVNMFARLLVWAVTRGTPARVT